MLTLTKLAAKVEIKIDTLRAQELRKNIKVIFS